MQYLMTYTVTVNHICLRFLNTNANMLVSQVMIIALAFNCKCREKSYLTRVNRTRINLHTLRFQRNFGGFVVFIKQSNMLTKSVTQSAVLFHIEGQVSDGLGAIQLSDL